MRCHFFRSVERTAETAHKERPAAIDESSHRGTRTIATFTGIDCQSHKFTARTATRYYAAPIPHARLVRQIFSRTRSYSHGYCTNESSRHGPFADQSLRDLFRTSE